MDADLKSKPRIVHSTDHYDSWLLALEPAFAHDLKQKLKVMAGEPGDFLRATFYRWSERLPGVCLETISAPVVRAVGDVHVGNFGTWPSDGDVIRWGLNDFDETGWMPFTNDLVRLATSALLARDDLDPDLVGRTILSGYSQRVEAGGFGALDVAQSGAAHVLSHRSRAGLAHEGSRCHEGGHRDRFRRVENIPRGYGQEAGRSARVAVADVRHPAHLYLLLKGEKDNDRYEQR